MEVRKQPKNLSLKKKILTRLRIVMIFLAFTAQFYIDQRRKLFPSFVRCYICLTGGCYPVEGKIHHGALNPTFITRFFSAH